MWAAGDGIRAWVVVPAVVVVLAGTGMPALADPAPSAKDVAAGKKRVRDKAREVGRLKARLALADGRLRTLAGDAETAVENYNGAVVRLGKAQKSYRGAQRRLTRAQQAVRQRRAAIGRMAADQYASGGAGPAAMDLVGPGGPQGFMDRAQLTQVFSRRESGTFGQLRAAQIVAGVFRRRAADDLTTQRRLTRSAARAKEAARAAVARQRVSVRQIGAEKRRLQRELGTDRNTVNDQVRRRDTAQRAARAPEPTAPAPSTASTQPTPPVHRESGDHGAPRSKGDIAADWALTQLGKPYVWAAAGPNAYDCSGLTMRAWQKAGVMLDHWTGTQWTSGPHPSTNDLHRGDLLLFGKITRNPATIHHVGIYIGHGQMVEAPFTGANVRISSIWRPDLVGATRPSG